MGGQESKPQQQTPPPPPAATKSPTPKPSSKSASSPQQQQPVAVKKRQAQNNKANSTDMAILEMKVQRDKLKKTTDKYYNLSEKMKEAAKEAMNQDPVKNKANAIFLIKRSKQYENQIETTAKQLLNLETSINAIEDGVLQVQIMQALEQGAKQLDSINKQLANADEVMENVREAVATQREISEILGAPVGDVDLATDDDELEAELNKIMGVENKKKAATTAASDKTLVDSQVKVPSHEPVKQKQDDDNVQVAEEEEKPARIAA